MSHTFIRAMAASTSLAALPELLPTGRDPAARAQRAAVFKQADTQGKQMLSLAGVDRAVSRLLGSTDVFAADRVMLRAFRATKARRPGGSDEHVDRSEFRLLLVYLRQWCELQQAYSALDSSAERRLSIPEFRAGVGLLSRWGIDIEGSEVQAEFARIDADGCGVVSFDAFAEWALAKQLDLEEVVEEEEDDDDLEDIDEGVACSAGKQLPGTPAASKPKLRGSVITPGWTHRPVPKAASSRPPPPPGGDRSSGKRRPVRGPTPRHSAGTPFERRWRALLLRAAGVVS